MIAPRTKDAHKPRAEARGRVAFFAQPNPAPTKATTVMSRNPNTVADTVSAPKGGSVLQIATIGAVALLCGCESKTDRFEKQMAETPFVIVTNDLIGGMDPDAIDAEHWSDVDLMRIYKESELANARFNSALMMILLNDSSYLATLSKSPPIDVNEAKLIRWILDKDSRHVTNEYRCKLSELLASRKGLH